MVTFQTPDGTPGFHQSESLDEAVTFVERLRNEQGVHNSRIFRMEELKFDFKPYYKVEISSAADAGPLAPPQRPAVSSRPAPPKDDTPLDLTTTVAEPAKVPEPVEAPKPVGVAAATESAPAAPAASSEPLPPPPPPPAKDTKSDESGEPPRRGLFTR